jgi:hypothetical protein
MRPPRRRRPPRNSRCWLEADGDTAMARRKGEIIRSDLEREWPHRVALPAEKVLGLRNSDTYAALREFIGAPLTYSLRPNDLRFVVFWLLLQAGRRRGVRRALR